jgi:hypothetical protein
MRTMAARDAARKVEASRLRRKVAVAYAAEAVMYAVPAGGFGWLVWAIYAYVQHNLGAF